MSIKIYKPKDFIEMRAVGALTAKILDSLYPFIKEGINTLEINDYCHQEIIKHGAIPAPLNYRGFPKSVCTSINDVICHGIPNKNDILKDSDIINVDLTLILEGYYGDASRMFCVGESFKDTEKNQLQKKLITVTYECLMKGIKQVKPGNSILKIGQAIQQHAEINGFSVVREFCGHGIGKVFHDEPNILHYYPDMKDRKFFDITMKEGMFFTIEPMINVGDWRSVVSKEDKWTARTVDGKLSAQFEHTIGVTSHGYEIFTKTEQNILQLTGL